MNEKLLDSILLKLQENRTDSIEVTDDFMNDLKLNSKTSIYGAEFSYLKKEDLIYIETITGYQSPTGYELAKYYISLTPTGLKFISEGGFTSKSNYAKETLSVAKQSRNWAIAAFVIAAIALFIQLYYGSCNG